MKERLLKNISQLSKLNKKMYNLALRLMYLKINTTLINKKYTESYYHRQIYCIMLNNESYFLLRIF